MNLGGSRILKPVNGLSLGTDGGDIGTTKCGDQEFRRKISLTSRLCRKYDVPCVTEFSNTSTVNLSS